MIGEWAAGLKLQDKDQCRGRNFVVVYWTSGQIVAINLNQ